MSSVTLVGIPDNKKRVEVQVGNHTLITDHKEDRGGMDAGPSMGATFLAGLVACTASTLRGYCKQHELPIPEKVIANVELDDDSETVSSVTFDVVVPADFPENRYKALIKAADYCTMKIWWLHPPEFITQVSSTED
jgi:putative redox protein